MNPKQGDCVSRQLCRSIPNILVNVTDRVLWVKHLGDTRSIDSFQLLVSATKPVFQLTVFETEIGISFEPRHVFNMYAILGLPLLVPTRNSKVSAISYMCTCHDCNLNTMQRCVT